MDKSERRVSASPDKISSDELWVWIEWACWATLGLAPLLYFVNGPAVSPDQTIVRITVVSAAAVIAPLLRLRALWRRWLAASTDDPENS